MRTPTDITPELLSRMRQLYADGEAPKAIGRLLKLSDTTVTKYCKGIEQRKSRNLTDKERAKLMGGWK